MQFTRMFAASALAACFLISTSGVHGQFGPDTPQQSLKGTPVPADVGAKGCGLPPLSLAGIGLYKYTAPWTASNWANAGSTIPWRYDHVNQVGHKVTLRLDSSGAPELQATQGTVPHTSGLWQVDVTMPQHMREGVVVAPLWLYDSASKDEIDFEIVAARQLTVSLHSWPGGVHMRQTVAVIPNVDFSGRRLCLGINLRPAAGKIEMRANGQVIYTWDRSKMNFFVSHPVRPWIELWAANPG